jgi:translation elongation factor EF-4
LAAVAAAADSSSNSNGSGVFGGNMGDRVMLRYQLPLSELAGDFYSRLKSATQG